MPIDPLPPLTTYLQLRTEIDLAVERLSLRHQQTLRCRPGCADCCRLTSVLPVEAAVLSRAFAGLDSGLRKQIRAAADPDFCPLLVDNRCAVYPDRPIICRTHGLPVAYLDEEEEALLVSACPVNFPEDAQLTLDDLLQMEEYNHRLREISAVLGPLARIPLIAIVG